METKIKHGRGKKVMVILGASFVSMIILIGCAAVKQSITASSKSHVEGCLAGFCLNEGKVMESEVIAKLGEGYTRHTTPVVGDIVHCYFDSSQEIWIEFTFDHHHQSRQLLEIFASRIPLCDRTYQPKTLLPPVKTAGGIAL